MKNRIIKKALIVFAFCSLGQFVLAQADAPKTLANVVTNLAHSATPEQKATLLTISNNKKNSASIQTIANAIQNFQHSVTADDKAKLEVIAADTKATASEKELALIMATFNHTATDETKARLAKIK